MSFCNTDHSLNLTREFNIFIYYFQNVSDSEGGHVLNMIFNDARFGI